MYIVKYSERVHMARMHELASTNSESCNHFIVPLFYRRRNQIINDLQAEFQLFS